MCALGHLQHVFDLLHEPGEFVHEVQDSNLFPCRSLRISEVPIGAITPAQSCQLRRLHTPPLLGVSFRPISIHVRHTLKLDPGPSWPGKWRDGNLGFNTAATQSNVQGSKRTDANPC